MKKTLIAMVLVSNLLFGQDLKIENLNLRNNTDMAYNQFLENQYLILNLPIKIKLDNQVIYVRFQDIKAISVSKDELKCTIIYHGSNSDVRAVVVKDYETREFIIELFEKQREQIHDALKYGR